MIRRLSPYAFPIIVLFIVTLPMLRGQRVAFRDVSHFYLPLYDYVAERTRSEWLPLWNPLDHMGMPLVGESTTSVLYPVRYAIFRLPFDSPTALNVYLIAHLMLASIGAVWLARRIGSRDLGAGIAGLVYPLSGSVYALTCNPSFLVGAAWLPLALGGCLLEMSNLRHRIAVVAFALSMMVLGGDPQMALHVLLVTIAVATIIGIRKILIGSEQEHRRQTISSPASMLGVALLSGIGATGLSAVQVAASLDWSFQSDRAASIEQRREAFEFSLPPWHLDRSPRATAVRRTVSASSPARRLDAW